MARVPYKFAKKMFFAGHFFRVDTPVSRAGDTPDTAVSRSEILTLSIYRTNWPRPNNRPVPHPGRRRQQLDERLKNTKFASMVLCV